jgi:hypothetical protein
MISSLLMAICFVSVDTSISILQTHEVQVNDRTQALDNLQIAQEAITKDIHAATTTWTIPTLPTAIPSQPITATTLAFTASLGGGTPTINIALNTSTHVLTVTCTGVGCWPGTSASSMATQAQISNVDSSSLFTLKTEEVSTKSTSVTTNSFYFTSVASTIVLDTPKVGALQVFNTTLTASNIVANNAEYSCQIALGSTGATGSC